MKNSFACFFLLIGFSFQVILAQVPVDSLQIKKEYTTIESALKDPSKVFRLNLSNKEINFDISTGNGFKISLNQEISKVINQLEKTEASPSKKLSNAAVQINNSIIKNFNNKKQLPILKF